MAPALAGQASGLQIACQIANADVNALVSIKDYNNATWHWGASRAVMVRAKRSGATPGVPAGAVVSVCPDNLQATAVACGGGTAPAGHLTIKLADRNHSVEDPFSSSTLTGVRIDPGTFIKCIGGLAAPNACTPVLPAGQVQLSKPILNSAAPNAWPACAPFANPCFSAPLRVLVSNDIGRAVTDGTTTAGSLCIGSATANFKAGAYPVGDVGLGIAGGDIPDSAVIAAVPGTCGANAAQISCAGCSPGFPVTTASAQVISLSPTTPAKTPSSSRLVTNGSCTGTRTVTGGGPAFAPSDVGLPITFVPPVANLAGARIGSIAANGATATLAAGQTGATLNPCPTGTGKVYVIGHATKTAPGTGDSAATLAIALTVNPTVSPTSPPCGAGKVSGFQIPITWRNPQGTAVAPPTNVLGPAWTTEVQPASAAGYNRFVSSSPPHLSGTTPAGHSIAQLDFRTASTSFSGYVQQTYATTTSVQGPSTYRLVYTFLPVGVGVCPGTDIAAQWNIFGLSRKVVENPSFTGGGGGGVRGIKDEVQGGAGTTYTGATGALLTIGATTPPHVNSCLVKSPPVTPVEPGCNW